LVANACWIVGPGRVERREEELPEPGPADVRVRARWGAISRGTERLVVEGRVPPEEAARMAAPFQVGAFPWPVKYGYVSVGEVEAGALPVGARVFCLYPHQDRYVVPVDAVHRLPDDVPSERAVLAANLETAINVAWDGKIGPGDRVVVVGGGVVGALSAWVASKVAGAEVHLVDVRSERATLAAALGLGFATPDAAPRDADVVVHASASAEGLETAIRCAGLEATVVEASWYGAGAVQAPLGGWFFSGRLRLVASQVGRIPAERAARWTYRRRLGLALKLLADPALDALFDGESAFRDLPTALPSVTSRPGLCHRVRYD
jgi:threonine dehydrogenase-like Zn-dependent dehydrogenase